MATEKPHQPILAFCERMLAEHGDSAEGMGWHEADAAARYDAMLGVLRPPPTPCTLLDFGCGTARLLDHLRARGHSQVRYIGLDASADAVAQARVKHPGVEFVHADVFEAADDAWPVADYVVMNGLLTYKGPLTQAQMQAYAEKLLRVVFAHARIGLAFNVHTPQVDWERADLFHAPMDWLATFLSRNLSRHVVFRADYGLYEYTAYVYRDPLGMPPERTRRLVGAA